MEGNAVAAALANPFSATDPGSQMWCVYFREAPALIAAAEKDGLTRLQSSYAGLPLKPGRCLIMTHDFTRNGTTSLFAALNIANGPVIGTCLKQHRHQEWIRFFNLINRSTPPGKQIHLICDNYATHQHAAVKAWAKRHPRFQFHFTPPVPRGLTWQSGFSGI